MNEREAFEAWFKEKSPVGGINAKLAARDAWLARAAVEAAQAQRVPDVWKVEKGFRWDGARQQHIPQLIVEFEPVSFDGPCDAKGWQDRNSVAALLASTPAPAQQSGWTEESGLVLDFASRVELSCYDQGSAECMAAVQEILDGKDRGDGVANEPWESIRRRLIALVAPAPAQQEPANPMDAHRAAYFMRRFLHEEKMLGPNEQAALHFTISALEAMESAAQHQEPPQQERKPMTPEQVGIVCDSAGYLENGMAKSDFINGIRHAERHHGIKE